MSSSNQASPEKALSFGGSGLMMMWEFGVAREIARDAEFMKQISKVHGTSGGAICGAMLVSCPDRFDDAMRYFETGKWLKQATPGDIVAPERLLRKVLKDLALPTRADKLRDRFVAHATKFPKWRNVALEDFQNDDEVLDAIAASCCLSPAGVTFRGERLYDGGYSNPLPSDPHLDTVAVSILHGRHVDLAPDFYRRGRYNGPPFLRYSVSPQNARALLETTFLTPKRARARYDQGQRDALYFLEAWHSSS